MSSKKSKLDPKLAKEVEEFDVENHFAIGNFLDIKDTEYNWCNAQIIDVDEQKRTLEVHFDSWSKKYDETVRFTSNRIRPFRLETYYYTGQKKSTLRDFDFDSDLHEKYIKDMKELAITQMSNINELTGYQFTQYVGGEFFFYVDNMFTLDQEQFDKHPEIANAIIELSEAYFDMLIAWMQNMGDREKWVQILHDNPYLYTVLVDAAVVNLGPTFVWLLDMIFDNRNNRAIITNNNMSKIIKEQVDQMDLVLENPRSTSLFQVYLLDKLIKKDFLKEVVGFLKLSDKSGSTELLTRSIALLNSIKDMLKAVKNTPEIQEFIEQVTQIFSQRVENLTDAEVKDLSVDSVKSVICILRDYYGILSSDAETDDQLSLIALGIIEKMLHSQFLEKKLTALNEIKKMGTQSGVKKNQYNEFGVKITPENLCKWVKKQKILKYIYQEAKHPELITRSDNIILLLDKFDQLEEEDLDLIWGGCVSDHKHEAVVEATLEVIKEIANDLDFDKLKLLSDKISKVPIKLIDEKMATFLNTFYQNAFKNLSFSNSSGYGNSYSNKKTKKTKVDKAFAELCNVQIFWDLMQEGSKTPQKVQVIAIDSLIELLDKASLDEQKIVYINESLVNLKKNTSINNSLEVLERIFKMELDQMPRQYQTGRQQQRIKSSEVLESVFKSAKTDVVKVVLESASHYALHAKKTKVKAGKVNTTALFGNLPHEEVIEKYFNFFEYMIKFASNYVTFNDKHIDQMFDIYVANGVSEVDENSFYNFFNFDVLDDKCQRQGLIDAKLRVYFFDMILARDINFTKMTTSSFDCFTNNFYFTNSLKKNCVKEEGEFIVRILDFQNLSGLDLFWELSVHCENEEIRQKSREFIIDIYMNYANEDPEPRGKNNLQFIQHCFEKIKEANKAKGDNSVQVLALLQIITTFVYRYDGMHFKPIKWSEYDKQSNIDLTVVYDQRGKKKPTQSESKYQIQVNKEFTMNQIRKLLSAKTGFKPTEILIMGAQKPLSLFCMEDKLSQYKDIQKINIQRRSVQELMLEFPRYILTQYRDLIYELIQVSYGRGNDCLVEALKLIDYLPLNSEDISTDCTALDAKKYNNTKYLLGYLSIKNSTLIDTYHGLLPIIRLMNVSVLLKTSEPKVYDFLTKLQETFIANFVERSGLGHLCTLMKSLKVADIKKDLLLMKVFQGIFEISKYLVLCKTVDPATRKEVISHALSCLEVIGSKAPILTGANVKYEQEVEISIVQNILCVINSCLEVVPKEVTQLTKMKNLSGIIKSLMVHYPEKQMNYQLAQGINKLCLQLKDHSDPPAIFFYHLLIKEGLKQVENNSTQYYELCNQILDQVAALNSKQASAKNIGVAETIKTLFKTLISKETVEFTEENFDPDLSGIFILLAGFYKHFSELFKDIADEKFVKFLIHDCLFFKEKILNRGKGKFPLCKNENTRNSCLVLLGELSLNHPEIGQMIQEIFEPTLQEGNWRTDHSSNWNTNKLNEDPRENYVGMVNLGCTCYMNSLMQQLFMQPQFRKLILEVPDKEYGKVEDADNVLYQTKMLFANLLESERSDHDPKNFFYSIKDFDGSVMPTTEQRDVDEFLNLYLDKIEWAIKGTQQEKDYRNIFGGGFAQELICKDCPHRSSRDEPFLAVSVDVKNKNELKDGLESFIQGEMLEGDNAYHCGKCDKKIDTLKRACIKKLPNLLLVVLKRFDFDYETLQRLKLNTYLKYPKELNMEDYCQETLAKNELVEEMKENGKSYEELRDEEKRLLDVRLPENYYNYKLKGTVIHSGTADAGHYYSYIQERDADLKNKEEEVKGSSSGDKEGGWFEFNDRAVNAYNPDDLPEDTFGGEYDKNEQITFTQGGKQITFKDKINNAYVLIYERDTFINVDEFISKIEDKSDSKVIQQIHDKCVLTGIDKPVNLEPIIKDQVIGINEKAWYKEKIFNQNFMNLMQNVIINVPVVENQSYNKIYDHSLQEHHKSDPADLRMMKFVTQFFLTCVLRTSDRANYIPDVLSKINTYCKVNLQYAAWILDTFKNHNHVEEFLIDCTITEMRRFVVGIIRESMKTIYAHEQKRIQAIARKSDRSEIMKKLKKEKKPPILLSFINTYIVLTHTTVREKEKKMLKQFYQIFSHFIDLGHSATEYLLNMGMLGDFLNIIFSNEVPDLEADELLEIDVEPRPTLLGHPEMPDNERRTTKFDRLMNLRYQMDSPEGVKAFLIRCVSHMVRCIEISDIESKTAGGPSMFSKGLFSIPDENGKTIPIHYYITKQEEQYLFSINDDFVRYLLAANGNRMVRNELAKLYGHITMTNGKVAYQAMDEVFRILEDIDFEEMRNMGRFLECITFSSPTDREDRITELLTKADALLKANAQFFKFSDSLINFILKMSRKYQSFNALFYQSKLIDRVNNWINKNTSLPGQYTQNLYIFKTDIQYDQQKLKRNSERVKEYLQRRKQLFKKIQQGKFKNQDEFLDSDDDIYTTDFSVGTKVDQVNAKEWKRGMVNIDLNDMIRVQNDVEMEDQQNARVVYNWVDRESENINVEGSMYKNLNKEIDQIFSDVYHNKK